MCVCGTGVRRWCDDTSLCAAAPFSGGIVIVVNVACVCCASQTSSMSSRCRRWCAKTSAADALHRRTATRLTRAPGAHSHLRDKLCSNVAAASFACDDCVLSVAAWIIRRLKCCAQTNTCAQIDLADDRANVTASKESDAPAGVVKLGTVTYKVWASVEQLVSAFGW